MSRRPRDEQGAVAIIVAIAAVLMVSAAALTVDLGNAFVVKREIQKRVDFAALAGGHGDNLPTPTTTTTCGYGARATGTDQAVVDVAQYFGTQATNSVVTAAQLRDCTISNGEVLYGTFSYTTANSTGITLAYDKNKLTVIAPTTTVDFGLAKVMGFNSVNVTSVATVQIGSQGINTLPLYAFAGCDYGAQTIAQPTNGQAAADVLLANGGDSNAVTPNGLVTNPATTPARVPLDVVAPDNSLKITGDGGELTGVTKIGFFESGTSGPGPAPVEVPTGQFTIAPGGNEITVAALPTGVTSVQTFWYVRVFKGGQWSAVTTGNGSNVVLNAPPLRVGDPTLTCGQGSSAGNFGTLLLPHSQGPNGQSDNIAYNIADGLEHSLGLFPTPGPNWLCGPSTVGAKLWPAEDTNCTDTKTGLDLNAAQDGFINGVSTKRGLLDNLNPKYGAGSGCAASGAPATRAFGSHTINNDTLSCFFTDTTTNVGDISSPSYPGPVVISSQIYKSPRFVRVPVLGKQPTNGGSDKYQIVAMRPGFITDQAASATKTTAPSASNGITASTSPANQLASVQVVFISEAALPPPPDSGGSLTTYTGGPKVLRLVN